MSETTCENVPSAAFPRLRSRWDVVGAPEDRDALGARCDLGIGSRFRRLRAFLFTPGVMVANVLYHLTSSHNLIASDAQPSIDGSEVSRHTGNAIRKIKTSP